MIQRSVCVVTLVFLLTSLNGIFSEKTSDSYLEALATTKEDDNHIGREDGFGGGFGPVYPSGGGGGYDYHPQVNHQQYGPPNPLYGAPHKPMYGPPHAGYGPPSGFGPEPGYGPPGFPYHAPGGNWLLDKFKLKLDLFTVGKILLKLIIFKKIVKFIALICLLLFLPKLKHDKGEQNDSAEENYRNIQDKDAFINERLNEVTNFAFTAIESFTKKNLNSCDNDTNEFTCRFKRMFNEVDKKYSYERIVKLYSPDDITLPQLDSDEIITE